MSVQAMSWVLEDAPGLPAHLVGVLIGLANHADRQGRGSYPGQDALAAYARKSDRSVRKDLAALLDLGLIREGDQRLVAHISPDRRPIVYDLAMERKQPPRAATDRNHSSPRERNQGSARKADTTGTTVPPASGTTVPGGTTVPAGTTGSSDRNHSSEPTGTTVPTNRPKNQKLNLPTTSARADAQRGELVLVTEPEEVTAQTLVAEWLEHRAERPPERVIGQVAKHLRELLAEGIDPNHVRNGLATWHKKNLNPASLPSVVSEVMHAPALPAVVDRRQQATDAMFDRAMERARKRSRTEAEA